MILFLVILMIVCVVTSLAMGHRSQILAKQNNYRAAYVTMLKVALLLLFAALNGFLIAIITSN